MDRLKNKKLAIIGIGHIGNALFKGLLNSGLKKEKIILSNSSKNNKKAVLQADWILLCVKPLLVHQVVSDIKNYIQDKLLISAAAVVSIRTIAEHTKNKKQKIIRIMPNINVAFNQGVVGLCSSKAVSIQEKNEVITLLSLLGTVLEVRQEQELDNLTLISACGPAIVSYFISMLSNTALSFGLSENDAELLALKTFTGTFVYLQKSKITPFALKQSVATKGGVTEEIIKSMEANNLYSLFKNSIENGKLKIEKLRREVNFNGND